MNLCKKFGSSFVLLGAFLFIVPVTQAQSDWEDWEGIPMTRWMSPDPTSRPITFKEWSRTIKKEKWQVNQVYPSCQFKQSYDYAIIVETALYDDIQAGLNQLKVDLEIEGGSVLISTVSGGTPQDLKDYLISISGLKGALFVGDLSIAWYQIDYEGERLDEFPCDLYFMDLNGTWLDDSASVGDTTLIPGSDSVFDGHTGNLAPEIFVGRLVASPIGDEVSLLNNYFDKAHNYRIGASRLPDTALCYVDDDWTPWDQQSVDEIRILYPHVTLVSDKEITRCTDYESRLNNDRNVRKWISLWAHSAPDYHCMKYNNGNDWDFFYSNKLPGIDADAYFYWLFCCSAGRFVENNYFGGEYIFTNTYGLDCIASTKPGSMFNSTHFYTPLAESASIGTAFKEWFKYAAEHPFPDWDGWFYGMTVCGDPFIKPLHTPILTTITVTEPDGAESWTTGTSHDITWTSNGVSGNVKIELYKGGNLNSTIANDTTDNGLYSWAIPATQTSGADYKVRVTSIANPSIWDESNSDFSIIDVGTEEEVTSVSKVYWLSQASPNPAIQKTEIRFQVPGVRNQKPDIRHLTSNISLKVYDMGGRLVKTLIDEKKGPGYYQVVWNMRDNTGKQLSSGIYFYKLETPKFTATRKLIIVQ